jgi:hypothetical protein
MRGPFSLPKFMESLLLGHRSLATTERYLRLTITDLKEAHAKFHPREQEQHAQGSAVLEAGKKT